MERDQGRSENQTHAGAALVAYGWRISIQHAPESICNGIIEHKKRL
jgi:hypothetical protein